MSKLNINDTIAAISTPLGTGGIGIVRLSGPDALAIAEDLFTAKDKTLPSRWKTHTVHYGDVVDRGRTEDGQAGLVIDEALVTVMRAPKSYTREDVVEISCHGSTASLRAILDLAVRRGARLAEPGEFTQRAFLNGRIDLTQAEAVLDIIQATTESFLKVSAHQLKGELTRELGKWRERIMNVYAELEAVVNFPEEDLTIEGRRTMSVRVQEILREVEALARTGDQGRLLKEGVRIVICGKPNVGKSSLLNALLKEPRAIVSPLPGTTRDTIEECVQVKGIPFRLIDTAGILEPKDIIEKEAIKRSRMYIESADLVLFVLDRHGGITPEDHHLLAEIKSRNVLTVVNKCDLVARINVDQLDAFFPPSKTLHVSALKNSGIDQLRERMADLVLQGRPIETGRVMVSNLRQIEALRRCASFLDAAGRSIRQELSLEFVSEDIRRAVDELDRITGRQVDQDLLQRIFSDFCIGK